MLRISIESRDFLLSDRIAGRFSEHEIAMNCICIGGPKSVRNLVLQASLLDDTTLEVVLPTHYASFVGYSPIGTVCSLCVILHSSCPPPILELERRRLLLVSALDPGRGLVDQRVVPLLINLDNRFLLRDSCSVLCFACKEDWSEHRAEVVRCVPGHSLLLRD